MVLVKVKEGTLEGTHEQNKYGGTFYSFKGIPYAEPPLGDLRFKGPQPLKPWKGVRSARQCGPDCYQIETTFTQCQVKSEDCLYLNVYTPNLKPSKPLAVMIWIHGGAFVCGGGNDETYGPEYIIRHDVILVTINYRLDVLGFLCLDIEEVPGNTGMKDQVTAMRWVKNNISSFGGDPENITIFGESAGGASVSYHLISPMTKGLFKRAIAQSGSSICNWANKTNPLERATNFAKSLGLDSTDPYKIYEFLKPLPVENIIKLDMSGINFAIVSEKQFGDSEAFFSGDVYDVLRKGIHEGVEVISGYNEHEGIFGILMRGMWENVLRLAHLPDFYCPRDIKDSCTNNESIDAGNKLKEYYLKDKALSKENIWSFVRFCSLADFTFEVIQWQKIAAKMDQNKFYVYKFTCKSDLNVHADILGLRDVIGPGSFVCHADDILYLFPNKLSNRKIDLKSKEFRMIETVTTLWTNFAKYGNPTPDNSSGTRWTPYTLDGQAYLEIGEFLVPKNKPEQEDVEFWEGVYRKYLPKHIL